MRRAKVDHLSLISTPNMLFDPRTCPGANKPEDNLGFSRIDRHTYFRQHLKCGTNILAKLLQVSLMSDQELQ